MISPFKKRTPHHGNLNKNTGFNKLIMFKKSFCQCTYLCLRTNRCLYTCAHVSMCLYTCVCKHCVT